MEKSNKVNIILGIISVIIVVVGFIIIGQIAFARFRTVNSGNVVAEIAKWDFKVVDGNPVTVNELDFPVTRTDNNNQVSSGTIAPGTYGQFEIDIDARGTETALNYEIKIDFIHKPVNLKFYSDSAKQNEITLTNGRLVLNKSLSVSDVNNIQPNIIYWSWPFQTGVVDQQTGIATGDVQDTLDMNNGTMQMDITVTGTQSSVNSQ